MSIGAEQTGAALRLVASDKNPWVCLGSDAYPRVRLIVLQQHIVVRLIFLNHAVLEVQSILLGAHHGVLQVGDVSHENIGARHSVHAIEIAAHAAF